MRLADRITALRAWCLMANLGRRKTGVLLAGFVWIRGQSFYDEGVQDQEYNPPTLPRDEPVVSRVQTSTPMLPTAARHDLSTSLS